jgi:uncharacterized membrane protein YphA (DoxX/SURF4 family)
MAQQQLGYTVLRLGLAGMFLWFGFSQLFDGVNWVGWVPTWAVTILHLPPAMIVLMNGSLEVIGGSLLALNLFTRWAALLLGLHLLVIAFEIGFNDIGIRDFGLAAATFALFFLVPNERPSSEVV